jgi:hypothetical protein
MAAKGKSKLPRSLVAVSVEPSRIEVVFARRRWRSWQLGSTETIAVPKGESLYDTIQRINLRPRKKQETALVLLLPRLFYAFHCEQYPNALKGQLEDALAYDWPENLFFEHEQTVYFTAPFTVQSDELTVPVFSMQKEVYEKFQQALDAEQFKFFAVVPSALAYQAMLDNGNSTHPDAQTPYFAGRFLSPEHLEIHRLNNSSLDDSLLLNPGQNTLKLFLDQVQGLSSSQNDEAGPVEVDVFCYENEASGEWDKPWTNAGLPWHVRILERPLVVLWLESFLRLPRLQSFTGALRLKPWTLPKYSWAVVLAVIAYALFGYYQSSQSHSLEKTLKEVHARRVQLERQWKPLEELQGRAESLRGARELLGDIDARGYPVLDLLTVLSQMIPEDTWLRHISVEDGRMRLRGESSSTVKALSEISRMEGIGEMRFTSPIRQDRRGQKELFYVQFQLDSDKLRTSLKGFSPDLFGQAEREGQGS